MATDELCQLDAAAAQTITTDAGELTMTAGTIKRIHVNQHIIKDNKKDNATRPPLTIKWRGKTYIASHVDINGESKVVYSPLAPLSCGAHVWVETTAEVIAYR